jgi:hypothetical protein
MRKLSQGVVGLMLLGIGAVAPVSAQEDGLRWIIHIHAGTCADPGDAVAGLTDLQAPAREAVGTEGATVAVASYSAISLDLDTLLGEPHLIDAHRSTDGQIVACGEIGGVPDDNGALAVGLRPMNESGFSGIAYLNPVDGNPAQTGISIFLAETGATIMSPIDERQPLDAATYANSVRAQVTLIVGSLQRVDVLFDAPRLDDQEWVGLVMAELALWQIVYGEAQELTAPAEYADFHDRYVAALALLDSAALDITEGFASRDQARLTAADGKINEAIAALRALDSTQVTATPVASPAASPAAAT